MKRHFTLYFLFFFTLSLSAQELLDLSLTHDDTTRNYKLYIPAAYDGSEEWPLVISYHEVGNTVEDYLEIIRTDEVADTAHFLIAYPVGLDVFNAVLNQVDPGWNDGFLPSQTNADDVGFTRSLIDSIDIDYNVDMTRVYAMGPGNGGAMAARVACEASDRIAAMADVGGFIECAPPTEVPGLFMIGTADPFVPIEGIPGLLPPFWEGVGNWAAANGCEADSTETPLPNLVTTDSSTVTLIEYPNCSGDSEVLYYKIEGGGRTWPGGEPIPVGGPTNRDINADVEIWNFFNRFTLQATAVPKLAAADIALRAYPNPASTQLNFEFELPEAATVTITLYNALGQTLHVLTDETLQAGAQQINWQRPNTVPDGLYFYQLQIGDQMVSESVVLGR